MAVEAAGGVGEAEVDAEAAGRGRGRNGSVYTALLKMPSEALARGVLAALCPGAAAAALGWGQGDALAPRLVGLRLQSS